jgi:hypothetical protein|tara:strand:- start:1628 stop:2827 length:1200 start_codon:yes stop_codon:yes gene_type:complete
MVFGSNTSSSLIQNASTAQLIPGRVISIDQSSTLSNGEITVEPMKVSGNQPGSLGIKATPLFPNVKNYPLINETVYLLSFPSGDFANSPGNIKYYYLTPVKTWANNIHTNPTPAQQENIKGSNQNKSITEIEAGSPNISTKQNTTSFKPGIYFNEKSNIYPLYPFEGDVILEGRFGNSLRLGSTDISGSTPLNNWSNSPSNGDPITILRNGQDPSLTGSAQFLITEDINKDLSSIYITSKQNIPIEVASTNDYLSYGDNPPVLPKNYAENSQVIVNSGRLIFNSTNDHILLSSNKSINLNSIEGIYTDTIGDTVFQSNKVYLGGTKNSQPIILGDELVTLLTDVLNDLSTLTNTLQSQPGVPIGAPLAPTSIVAQTINFKINGYKQRLKNTLSNTTSTV